MKIAVITTLFNQPWGGSEELWALMLDQALEQGHAAIASVYHWPEMPAKIAALRQKGATILHRYRPGTQKLHKAIGKSLSISKNLFRLGPKSTFPFEMLFRLQPDVIVINQGGTYEVAFMPALLHELYRSAIPYLVICHSNDDSSEILNHVTNPAIRNTMIEVFDRAAQVAFVSRQNLETTERHLAKTLSNVVILKNPVNLSDPTPVPWPASETLRMASVGRLQVLHKGQDILFEALAADNWRNRSWQLSLYGSGKDQDYLERLAKHYGIADRILFCGHVSDVRKIWAENHLLVLPSRVEGTPLALVEAMLCGRPAVVTDVGGNVDWTVETKTGFIAPAPTANSLKTALEQVWQSRFDLETMGQAAHELAMSQFEPAPGQRLLEIVLKTGRVCQPA